jgi:hypothetical protein
LYFPEQFDRKYDHVLRILGVYSADYKLTYDNLDYFLEKLGYPPTIKTSIAKDNKSLSVDAFQFTVVARHMTEWWNRAVGM